jgi:hypothetical protein
MEPALSIELPEGTPLETIQRVTGEVAALEDVETATAPRSILGAALLVVEVAPGVLTAAATAIPLVEKIVHLVRGAGVTGAKIELPDGTKVSVDSASAGDIERLLRAAVEA